MGLVIALGPFLTCRVHANFIQCEAKQADERGAELRKESEVAAARKQTVAATASEQKEAAARAEVCLDNVTVGRCCPISIADCTPDRSAVQTTCRRACRCLRSDMHRCPTNMLCVHRSQCQAWRSAEGRISEIKCRGDESLLRVLQMQKSLRAAQRRTRVALDAAQGAQEALERERVRAAAAVAARKAAARHQQRQQQSASDAEKSLAVSRCYENSLSLSLAMLPAVSGYFNCIRSRPD